MGKNNLFALSELGQSPWYDNIDRNIILNGELKKLFDLGVMGVTSNPSIFEKAVKGSSVYDDAIKEMAAKGKSPIEIYDILTVQDVQSAADLLFDVYKKTRGLDGYVSLEVNPDHAYNIQKTIENARMLHHAVGRPNVMIKVPGTKEGPAAIRILTREGINVNVTLLFSLDHYEAAARAYMAGLRDRVKEEKPINSVCSVASLFISRVDTAVDKALDGQNNSRLKGRAAVANAKMIYQRFKQLFFGKEFDDLRSEGACMQRVLWGSTSTKNPEYKDLKYVEELIGKHTINTLPHSTLKALLDDATIRLTIEENLQEEKVVLEELESLEIDLNKLCDHIQEQGVNAFATSFHQLIEAIEKKAET